MALRIACDLDGTLADMDAALQQHAERLFGPHVDLRMRVQVAAVPLPVGEALPAAAMDEAPPPRRPLTSVEMRHLWSEVRRVEDFWTRLDEIEPGAVARLGALAAAHRWEVLFITQRPGTAGETAQRQSQRWLQAHGFELPSVSVVTGSRGRVADSLGLHAVIDDRPEHCIDVKTESQARPLLVWRHRPASIPRPAARLDIDVVTSAAAAFDVLEEMTRRASRRGVSSRLRDAIGAS